MFTSVADGLAIEIPYPKFHGGTVLYTPEDPWDWYIYLHENHKNQLNVGKYTIHGSSGYQLA